jgi:hypothetical protein
VAIGQMDQETAESVAGVVRLLRRAAELAWAQAEAQGPGSPRQVFALGVDLAADEARNLLDGGVSVEGPMPVGEVPAGLLRSADQLLRRVGLAGDPAGLHRLQTMLVELVWEANTGAGA